MGEVGDRVAVHLEVDGNGRAAKLGMGGRGGVGIVEAAEPGNIPGQFENSAVVNLVQHELRRRLTTRQRDCALPTKEYIGSGPPARARRLASRRQALHGSEASYQSHVKWECGVRSSRMGRILQSAYD